MKGLILLLLLGAFQLEAYSAPNEAFPFPLASVELTPSWIKQREDLNTAYLLSLDPERLLHNFRVNAGLPSGAEALGGWEAPYVGLRGHFTGHYLSALASLVERYGEANVRERLDYLVEELRKCQQTFGNGYLSAFPETDFDVLETRYGGVWAPYYTYNKIMQGLLDAHVYAGNAAALEMVNEMAAYVAMRMSRLDDDTIERVLYSVGANPTNEPGAMNEVLYQLHKVTEDPAHLELAKVFDRDWFLDPLAKNKNILSGLHSNTHIVLVNGFGEAYSSNGENRYRDAVVNFWDMLHTSHVYANGSSSGPRPNVVTPTSLTAEHWGVPGQLSNTMTREIAETCVSHNTQKLSETLFSWTADPKYADAHLNTFYNSVLALQSARSGRYVYHLPLGSPREKAFLADDDFRCCNGSSIEAFARLNSGIYFHADSTLWVNLYVPSKLHWTDKDVTVSLETNFPRDPAAEFTVSTPGPVDLDFRLLIPTGMDRADVYVNGEKQSAEAVPGSYLSLRRRWENNDKIRIDFSYEFHIRAMPDDEDVVALFYGPILLAFETRAEVILKGDHEAIIRNLVTGEDPGVFLLRNNGRTHRLRPLFDIEGESYGVYATVRNY